MTPTEPAIHSNAHVIYEFERRAFPVSDVPVRIGRDASNDIVLHESAVSRFNTEIRHEEGRCVIHSPGSTPTLVNGLPAVDGTTLSDGSRIEVGSAVFTYTEKRLPIGVSVVERAQRDVRGKDNVTNRRDTIKNPLIKGPAEEPRDPQMRMKILIAIAAVALLLYFLGR